MENRILGHESVGEVVEVGSAVKNFKPGDRVIVNCCTPDWGAPLLQDGFDNNAHDAWFTSGFKFVMQKDGVFAEYYHVNCADGNLFLMPNDISIEDALMTTDMMSTGFLSMTLTLVTFAMKSDLKMSLKLMKPLLFLVLTDRRVIGKTICDGHCFFSRTCALQHTSRRRRAFSR